MLPCARSTVPSQPAVPIGHGPPRATGVGCAEGHGVVGHAQDVQGFQPAPLDRLHASLCAGVGGRQGGVRGPAGEARGQERLQRLRTGEWDVLATLLISGTLPCVSPHFSCTPIQVVSLLHVGRTYGEQQKGRAGHSAEPLQLPVACQTCHTYVSRVCQCTSVQLISSVACVLTHLFTFPVFAQLMDEASVDVSDWGIKLLEQVSSSQSVRARLVRYGHSRTACTPPPGGSSLYLPGATRHHH